MALIVYTLNTVPREDKQLADLLTKFNNACLYAAEYAFAHNEFTSNVLDKALNPTIQKRFSLPSHVTRTVIKTVSRDIHNLKTDMRVLANMPDYGADIVMRYEAPAVSVVMEALHPAHSGAYPLRLSISVTNERGGKPRRLALPFTRTTEQEQEPPFPMWLTFNEEVGRWQFCAVNDKNDAERPDEEVGEDEVIGHDHINDYTPYEEPDYTPPEMD